MGENIYNILLIKDLARQTGFSVYTLKYYLKVGLIHEVSRSPETRFRYFDNTTIDKLRKIRALRKEGHSISQIKNELL
ncbi:MAG: MerR family transcriptional regulator [Candidatus Omnitrophota bacterium]